MRAPRPAPLLGACAMLAAVSLLVSGCGNTAASGLPGDRIHGDELTVYVSLPFEGDERANSIGVLDAARLALAQIGGRIGHLRLRLRVLDDATLQRGSWDPGQTTADARLAAADPTAIGYVGDLDSGASAVSIPILNRVGIPQVSPTSTAVGLTSQAAGAAPGEPAKYYPTGIRTFARVVPNDAIQASVQVQLQRSLGCTRVAVVQDGEVDGQDMADSFQLVARAAGLPVTGEQAFTPHQLDYAPFAASVAQAAPDCVLVSAGSDSGAPLVTRALASALPRAQLFATANAAQPAFADPAGGVPTASQGRILLTLPTVGDQAGKAAQSFYAAYTRRYGAPPWTAVLGYAATNLLLDAISRATDHGEHPARRSDVLRALFSARERTSVLGAYSIGADGDTTLRRYGIYRLIGGELRFSKAISGG